MKKVISTFLLVACVFLSMIGNVGQVKSTTEVPLIEIYIDGEKILLDTKPIILNNRTMVPLRGVFEKLNVVVDWNKSTNQVIIKNDRIEVLLEIDNEAVLVNGEVEFLDASSILQDDRTLIPVRFVAEALGHKVVWDDENWRVNITTQPTQIVEKKAVLPTLRSQEVLEQLLHYNQVLNNYIRNPFFFGNMAIEDMLLDDMMPTDTQKEETTGTSDLASTTDFSDTNNQTVGVDEGDIIKTNGNQIFSLNQNRIHILSTNPENPEVLSTIDIDSQRGAVSEIFIEENHLIIIGSSYVYYGYPKEMKMMDAGFAPSYMSTNTFVITYNVSDLEAPILEKDMDFEGSYSSSRLIGDKLYVITNKGFDYWGGLTELTQYQFKPKYANNLTGEVTVIDYDQIYYFPDYVTPNYMLTIGIDLSSDEVEVNTYLGSAEIVYASQDNLYLSFTKYEYAKEDDTLLYTPHYDKTTSIYKFALDDGKVIYQSTGSVPGSVLNQFSFDEYEGNLRIATTTGEMWDETNTSKNNIYILDINLIRIGSLTDLAPGERIYSTRYAGSRIYMVTFRQVDPFFVIDASDPTAPKVLGDLKIPGFSTYMHILDENHILGFGSDTVEADGGVSVGGFKISLFDVTNPELPVEKDKQVIGIAGTYSELQYNHKALMISLSKGIMAFPISVAGSVPYVTDFIGAYVYNVSSDDIGFKGTITHHSIDTTTNYVDYKYFDYNYNINRTLYIGDYLYSISGGKMVVTKLGDMTTSGEVILEQNQADMDYIMPMIEELE